MDTPFKKNLLTFFIRRRRQGRPIVAMVASFVMAWLAAGSRDASAEQLLISHRGEHPAYFFELEPEVIIVFNRSLNDGPGVGVRGSIPILQNGFIPSINNSVAISFGIDKDPIGSGSTLNVPVALQWNFWLSDHWSVLGEPGIFIQFDDTAKAFFQLWGGARYHFNDAWAVMARVTLPNAPAFSVGVSFFF
jgi:hypothetical protein